MSTATVTTFAESTLPPDAPCALSPIDPAGTITFVRDGRVLEVAADGTGAHCLLDAADASGRLQWSSAGDRVLLGPATVADASGRRASGFFADNTKVSWSTPTGKALIAPRATDGKLVWRSSTNSADRLDVSFMEHTDFAVYHPSGKAIAATGVGLDGTPGVFIATNRGAAPQAIARLETPNSTLTELGFEMSGQALFFVHHHDDTGDYHVHRLELSSLTLIRRDRGGGDGQPPHGQHGAGRDARLAGQRRRSAAAGDGQRRRRRAGGGRRGRGVDAEPVGWLADGHLVVRTQPAGSAAGTPGRPVAVVGGRRAGARRRRRGPGCGARPPGSVRRPAGPHRSPGAWLMTSLAGRCGRIRSSVDQDVERNTEAR